MHKLTQAILVIFAGISTASLYSIESHASLGALALATMAVERPAPRAPARPGVQKAQASTPHGQGGNVVEDGGDAEEPRFAAGGMKLPDGTLVQVVEDREARNVLYIVADAHGISVTAVHIPLLVCEDDSIAGSNMSLARGRIR